MAFAFALCVRWGMGADSVANAMGASVGPGAVTLRRGLPAAGIWLTVASMCGWPVSATHSIVGAICGAGVAALGTGIGALNMRVSGGIILSWIITVPVAGILAAIVFHILRAVFS